MVLDEEVSVVNGRGFGDTLEGEERGVRERGEREGGGGTVGDSSRWRTETRGVGQAF